MEPNCEYKNAAELKEAHAPYISARLLASICDYNDLRDIITK